MTNKALQFPEEVTYSLVTAYASYPDRHITQTWNVLHLVRILLNESILEYCLASGGALTAGTCFRLVRILTENTETLACGICASVPQYVDCFGAADHVHSPAQNLDSYILIFLLYVAGRSSALQMALRTRSPNSCTS